MWSAVGMQHAGTRPTGGVTLVVVIAAALAGCRASRSAAPGGAGPDYARAFPQDRVGRLDLTISPAAWAQMRSDLEDQLGPAGARPRGGPGGGPGHGPPGGGPPPEALAACAGADVGAACTVQLPGRALDGTCQDLDATRACVPAGGPGGPGGAPGDGAVRPADRSGLAHPDLRRVYGPRRRADLVPRRHPLQGQLQPGVELGRRPGQAAAAAVVRLTSTTGTPRPGASASSASRRSACRTGGVTRRWCATRSAPTCSARPACRRRRPRSTGSSSIMAMGPKTSACTPRSRCRATRCSSGPTSAATTATCTSPTARVRRWRCSTPPAWARTTTRPRPTSPTCARCRPRCTPIGPTAWPGERAWGAGSRSTASCAGWR
jgi:hypothetical protein